MTEHLELLRRLIEANRFMALGTADEAGSPWVSPVWYATDDCRAFYWVSDPGARHSRNLAQRPEVAITIYDSHLPGTWQSVYLRAHAERVGDDELDAAIAIYAAHSRKQGLSEWTLAQVTGPAKHRLYRATASEHFLLDDHDERVPVALVP
jgi:nitroimidazol reductase NimA-like FMN-containing flavoprotein (pyridoxamine 5'-phosphate oxidase superfamily)